MPGDVTIRLPAVLAQMVGGERRFQVQGDTLEEALRDLVRQRPGLGLHLFDDSGSVRHHILCFHNQEYSRGDAGLHRPLTPGDTITLLNSVSGG